MRFAQTYASVNKKRVVNLTRRLGHSQGCGVGQVVVGTNHEGIEGVLRI